MSRNRARRRRRRPVERRRPLLPLRPQDDRLLGLLVIAKEETEFASHVVEYFQKKRVTLLGLTADEPLCRRADDVLKGEIERSQTAGIEHSGAGYLALLLFSAGRQGGCPKHPATCLPYPSLVEVGVGSKSGHYTATSYGRKRHRKSGGPSP